MAKKIKFPLIMKNNFQVRTIEELREHFDLDKAIEYFLDGKLLAWLEARYYEQESVAIRELGKDEAQLHQKLCNILGVEYDEAETGTIDVAAIAERNRKLNELKQYTSDATILEKVDQVAFNQEDLADLLDEGVHDIYLCNNSFVIPLQMAHRRYIGVGKAEAVIRCSERVDFDAKRIAFENVHFDSAYEKLHNETPEQLYQKGLEAENRQDYSTALEYYRKVADAGNPDGFFKLGWFYGHGYDVGKDYSESYQYYRKAADMGDKWALNNIGVYHENGWGVPKSLMEAVNWYKKAADAGNVTSMRNIGNLYNGFGNDDGLQKDPKIACEWYKKAAELGDTDSMYQLGRIWYWNKGNWDNEEYYNKKKPLGKDWLMRAVNNGSTDAMRVFAMDAARWHRYEESMEWFKKAVEGGDIRTLREYFDKYNIYGGALREFSSARHGLSCDKPELSRKYSEWFWSKGVESGDAFCLYHIARHYDYNVKNYTKAIEFYSKCIESNSSWPLQKSCYSNDIYDLEEKSAIENRIHELQNLLK